MANKRVKSNYVKKYYRDCGKGLSEADLRIAWGRIRGFPSYLYQAKRIIDTKRELKSLKLNGKILDAACGSGYILSSLPKNSVGIDINPRHIKAAKKYAPQAKVINGDIEKMPFGNGEFSAVLATEIFEHIPDSSPSIREMWRVLKNGGFLVATVPARNFLWKIRFLASSMYATEPQCLPFSKESFLSLFSGYKYKIVEFKKIALGLNYILILKKMKNGGNLK